MTCLVAGSGISGIGAAKLLLKKGAAVIVYDGNEKLNREDILQKFGGDPQTEVVLGELPQAVINCVDLMVLSPGIAIDAPFVNRVRKYRDFLYLCRFGHDGTVGDGGGDQQFPAGIYPYLSSRGVRDPEYYAGSLKPALYDGKLYSGKAFCDEESDAGRLLCFKL